MGYRRNGEEDYHRLRPTERGDFSRSLYTRLVWCPSTGEVALEKTEANGDPEPDSTTGRQLWCDGGGTELLPRKTKKDEEPPVASSLPSEKVRRVRSTLKRILDP